LFLKNFPTLEKNKKRLAQPDKDIHKQKQTMTLKPYTDNGLQGRWTRTPATNTGFAKVAVQCFV
jgi:hypothetical protein